MMDHKEAVYKLGSEAWEFRRQSGFSKSLPVEIQVGVSELVAAGVSRLALAKALGVTDKTISNWAKKHLKSEPISKDDSFNEVTVVDERPALEAKLIGRVHGCRVELTGSDFSLLQRLFRKLA
jgi:transcriptional regulator with XRE-family HTH domain